LTSRYPEMSVDTAMITRNAEKVVGLCSGKGISVWGVTKGLSAHPAVASAMLDGGCVGLADSRVDNIRKLRLFGFRHPMMLLRIPMPGEMTDVAENVDCCLVSMPASVLMLDRACDEAGSEVGIIVMVDLGDLREGIWPDGVEEMADALLQSRRTRCLGVGSNLGCLSGVLPSTTNLSLLVRIGGELSTLLGHPLEVVSGGATSSLSLVEDGTMPEGVNQLRVGEGILLGTDVTGNRVIPYLERDAIRITAEVVEVRRKPSMPIGKTGADAFGNIPVFQDRGTRRRVIVAMGRQDVRPEGLTPIGRGFEIIGASSDHLTLDAEDFEGPLNLGDTISFAADYGAMLAAATSPYVRTKIIKK